MKLPLGTMSSGILVNSYLLATSIMLHLARYIPPAFWDKPYEGGQFGPVEHLIHVTKADGFFRRWASDMGGVTTGTFRLPGVMRAAMKQESKEKQRMLRLANQEFVINAREEIASLDGLIEQFSESRRETNGLLLQISEANLQTNCVHPVTGLGGSLGWLCYTIFAIHVMEHSFKLHQQLVELEIDMVPYNYP